MKEMSKLVRRAASIEIEFRISLSQIEDDIKHQILKAFKCLASP